MELINKQLNKVNENRETTFLERYKSVHEPLTRFCRAMAGNTEDAEDLLHDTVLNAMENFSNIKNLEHFKTYVFSIASNLFKKKLRRQKFKGEFNAIEASKINDLAQDPEYYTDFQIIYNKIMSLPQNTAEAMVLFHISDMRLEDIQKIQGGSLSAVKQRLKRGREKLLDQLESPAQLKLAILFLNL